MRYKVTTPDDASYQRVRALLRECGDAIKVEIPERNIIGAELTNDEQISALRELGARVTEDFQHDLEGAPSVSRRIG